MCFQNGFLVLCVVRCGVWSVLLILFFASGLCVEFVDALGFWFVLWVLARLFCFACDMGFGMVDLGCAFRMG